MYYNNSYDQTSKFFAVKVAIANLVLTFFSIVLLVCVATFIIEHYDDQDVALHLRQLLVVELLLNILFSPWEILLIYGIHKDKWIWVRRWVLTKILQVTYIFIINLAIFVYVTAMITSTYGALIVIYTIFTEGFYLAMVIYLNGYFQYQTNELAKTALPEKIVV